MMQNVRYVFNEENYKKAFYLFDFMKVIKFVLVLFLFLFLFSRVCAIAGVSPASYEVNFQPNMVYRFQFNFLLDEGVRYKVYAEGDFAEHVKLDKDYLFGSDSVIAELKMPDDAERPGNNVIAIGAMQARDENSHGVGLVANIRGLIIVNVPYPGKYIEMDLKTHNANAGEDIEFTVDVQNLGRENITANTLIEISNTRGKIETIDLGSKFIQTTTSAVFSKKLNTDKYKPGDYNATAIVYYGAEKPAKDSEVFRLGELYVEIINYTEEFKRDTINRFNIDVESFWNDPIENLYANVSILDYDIRFLTPSIELNPWSKERLEGFFDTSGIESSRFKANITLHYKGKTTSEVVKVKFKRESDLILYVIIGVSVLALIILAVLTIAVIILFKRLKTRGRNGKKKKRKKI